MVHPVVEVVIALVKVQVKTVPLVGLPGELAVEVVKSVSHNKIISIADPGAQHHDRVDKGFPARDNEARILQFRGALQCETGIRDAEAQRTFERGAVALTLRDIDHRREPAAEPGREPALVQVDGVDDIGVEDRHESAKMIDIYDRHIIKKIEVLTRVAAPHEQEARSLVLGLDPGHELESLQNIGTSAKGGKLAEFADPERGNVRHGPALTSYHNLLQLTAGLHGNGKQGIAAAGKFCKERAVADK